MSEDSKFFPARKFLVLKTLKEEGGLTARELSERMDIDRNLASVLLHRYWKNGLVGRKREERVRELGRNIYEYCYYLKEKRGENRLEWLEGRITPERAESLLEREVETRGRPKEG